MGAIASGLVVLVGASACAAGSGSATAPARNAAPAHTARPREGLDTSVPAGGDAGSAPRDAFSSHPRPSAPAVPATLTICTQNLWNYGDARSVHDLRRRNVSLAKVEADLARQEPALVARMSGCDVVAVQELVGGTTGTASAALERLAARLSAATAHPYAAHAADTKDVIRNGFLVRTDGPFRVTDFNGRHSFDPWRPVPSFPPGRWDRGPAELRLEMGPARVRIVNAHLKSKIEVDGQPDPDGERWERLRVLQARALSDLVRRRRLEDPGEIEVVAGDLNDRPGAAARAVLGGGLDPGALVSPRDCIGPQGELTCDLPIRPELLVDLAASDPDLRGRGSYRFERREELIDAIFITREDAGRAREPGGDDPGDFDVRMDGRFFEGSDHRLLRLTLHF